MQKWLHEEQNRGLVIYVRRFNRGHDGTLVETKVVPSHSGKLFVAFKSCRGPADTRSKLYVCYRVKGNSPPTPPSLPALPAGWKLYDPLKLGFKPSRDPDSDKVSYGLQVGYRTDDRLEWRKLKVAVEGNTLSCSPRRAIRPHKRFWFRLRAVDEKGSRSKRVERGPAMLAERAWTVWSADGNRKIWADAPPPPLRSRGIKIYSAKNEWEPIQIMVSAHSELSNVRLKATKLSGERNQKIPAPIIYREHFIPVQDSLGKEGGYAKIELAPDALVPLIHPLTGRPTGGKYGGDKFTIAPGHSQPFRLEVFDFTLPSPRHLVACFEMGRGSVIFSHQYLRRTKSLPDPEKARNQLVRLYEEMLHEHYINNWSPMTGWNYSLNGVKVTVKNRKVSVDWTEFDRTVEPHMDGSGYKDGVPAQWLFVPYWIPVRDKEGKLINRIHGKQYQRLGEDHLAQYVAEVQRRFIPPQKALVQPSQTQAHRPLD